VPDRRRGRIGKVRQDRVGKIVLISMECPDLSYHPTSKEDKRKLVRPGPCDKPLG